MRLSQSPRRAAVGVGLAALLLLSACSSTSTTPTSSGTSSTSAPSSSATSTPSPTGTVTSSAPPVALPTYTPGQSLTADQVTSLVSAAFTSLSTVHMEMTMKATSGNATMSADADYGTNPISLSGTMTMAQLPTSAPMQVVFVDGNFYMNLGALSQNLYIKVSLAQLSSSSGVNILDSFDPAKSLNQFANAVTGGTFVGHETLDGAAVDHYTVLASTKKLVQANSALLSGAPKKALKKFTSKKIRVVESLWIDGSGHIVKVVTQSFGGSSTVLFSKFGVPVAIAAPPSDQVTEVPGLS